MKNTTVVYLYVRQHMELKYDIHFDFIRKLDSVLLSLLYFLSSAVCSHLETSYCHDVSVSNRLLINANLLKQTHDLDTTHFMPLLEAHNNTSMKLNVHAINVTCLSSSGSDHLMGLYTFFVMHIMNYYELSYVT